MEYLVQMENMTMKFSVVVALDDVSFDLRPGEVHVLLGENGAGKSTLVKILSGINHPTSGKIHINGETYDHLTPDMSKENQISIIYQELSVINELSIAENLYVGKLPTKKILGVPHVNYAKMNRDALALMNKVGIHRPASTFVQNLSISEKQMVEIAKALAANAKIIIMDEPTSSLSVDETENLFRIIRQLKAEGMGIIYISHKLKEITQIGDRVTILKDGKYMGTRDVRDITVDDLIPMMVGRKIQTRFLRTDEAPEDPEVIFSVRDLTCRDHTARNISFDLYKGEILGIAGLIGAGRSECMEGIFGVKPISSGEVLLRGRKLKINNPYDALKSGLAFVTENRRETGFFPNFEIWKEISVTTNLKKSGLGGMSGMTHRAPERRQAEEMNDKLHTKCSGIDQMTINLSGGNQQKVIVSKWLAVDSDVFIFDEPTKGIDVGAKSEMYQIMRDMVESGKGVIMVTSDMTELLSTCDRIIVFADGRITASFTNAEASEEKIMQAAVAAE